MSKYDFRKIEKKWQKKWLEEGIYEPNLKNAKKPFYNLMMFPYPSAEGLHVGNMYAFTGADIYGRMKRMEGYDVFEPMGLDGFGIHSENYALKIGAHPMKQAVVSEKRFYEQLRMIGNGFAWNERLETYDPEYYKWTQWIFIQLFKKGLAYRKKQAVNWCPSCKTVLADEQVINARLTTPTGVAAGGQGKCERCGATVTQKELEQWFFRITKYAERLLKNLKRLDWSERVKIAQRNWIGRSIGAEIEFPLKYSSRNDAERTRKNAEKNRRSSASSQRGSATLTKVEVFTTRPDTLFGATYMVLAPEHPLVTLLLGQSGEVQLPKVKDRNVRRLNLRNIEEVRKYVNNAKKKSQEERIAEGKEKTGIELKGVKAINPATKEEIPVWVADYVLADVGTGAIMAVPAHDERDFEFAKKYELPIKQVITPRTQADLCADSRGKLKAAYTGEGVLIDSGKFTGMDSEKAKREIVKFVGGRKKTQYKLRDWLISRQRYWGPPIPIIYCRKCWEILNPKSETLKEGTDYAFFDGKEFIIHPAPEKGLPVKLPNIKNFKPLGTGKSPLAASKSFYETKCPKCGGYARRETDVSDTFLDSAWYYIGFLAKTANSKFEIRNSKFRALARRWLPAHLYTGGAEHSVLHLLYVRFIALALHDLGILEFGGSRAPKGEPFPKFRAHGLLISEGVKMSKSKENVVNPDDYIKKFGVDTLRMYLMFLAPFEQGGDFRDAGILGIERFLQRVWTLATKYEKVRIYERKNQGTADEKLNRLLHKAIKKVTEDIENLQYNTAVSALMILLNEMEHANSAPSPGGSGNSNAPIRIDHLEVFLKLLAPFAPHIAEELYQQLLGNSKSETLNPKQTRNSKSQNPKRFKSIHLEPWPEYDPKLIEEKTFTLVIQINGKVRDQIEANRGISRGEAEKLALQSDKVQRRLANKGPKRVIYIPDRLINFVI